MPGSFQRDAMPYFLFLCEGRVLAQNIDGRIIDLGEATDENGTFAWRLDGNDEHGEGLQSAAAVLDDIAGHLEFLFLDGQFTSLPDVADDYAGKLDDAPAKEILLNEMSDKGGDDNPPAV
ncbi:hypothetical protein ROK90_04765 [Cronobacter dublinensis]|uniref:hypothetical protein n=1 Tax=Cronobacter dublinensis TaxID=413497 RepID=UPI0023DD0B35|nr:hypothetical protein [Cronobacter dublinensis]MDT3665327.1 hypothetical protein [Cronobacter dublinensis]WEP47313.1 hypothetical protein NNQ27_10600 [Cronobacter dublinensis]